MGGETRSYWHATAPRFEGGRGAIEGPVDVAIVGAGFTGLSAALALAERGASVAVLEAETVGAGASGRNGGHVNNGTAVDPGAIAARLGRERAQALYRAYDDAVDTVEQLVRDHQIACDFARHGKIKLAAKPGHYERLARGFESLHRDFDPETELVAPGRVRDEIGSDAFHGGVVFRKSAQMHMGKFVAGLADAAVRQGARIVEQAPVTGLGRNGGRHLVVTPGFTLEAGAVLLATGASQRGPFGWLRRRIVPLGSFIIATERLSDEMVAAVLPRRRTATTTRHVGHYFRLTPDNRLIWGGRARFALSDPDSDAKAGRILEATLRRTFPQLGGVRIEHCWGGVIDLTADRLPRAGCRDGVHYAMGYSGHGTQMSVHLGRAMARVIAGETGANPLGDLAWPAIPGHFGRPWFLPALGAYYRFKDWLN